MRSSARGGWGRFASSPRVRVIYGGLICLQAIKPSQAKPSPTLCQGKSSQTRPKIWLAWLMRSLGSKHVCATWCPTRPSTISRSLRPSVSFARWAPSISEPPFWASPCMVVVHKPPRPTGFSPHSPLAGQPAILHHPKKHHSFWQYDRRVAHMWDHQPYLAGGPCSQAHHKVLVAGCPPRLRATPHTHIATHRIAHIP